MGASITVTLTPQAVSPLTRPDLYTAAAGLIYGLVGVVNGGFAKVHVALPSLLPIGGVNVNFMMVLKPGNI